MTKAFDMVGWTYFSTCATVFGPNHWPTFLPSETPMDAATKQLLNNTTDTTYK